MIPILILAWKIDNHNVCVYVHMHVYMCAYVCMHAILS